MKFFVDILITKMEENKQHYWHFMLYYFKKGKNVTEMEKKKICAVYGEGAVTDRMCQKWFVKFRAGDFLLDDAPQSSRAVEGDSEQMETLIENNQCFTMREIATYPKYPNNKVIGESEKCVFHFVEKISRLFGQPKQ